MSRYDRSVNAAMRETASKFKLAEALALDIPADVGGAGEKIDEAREAIIEAGGEPRANKTLADYRLTAIHFQDGWAVGSSFASHNAARVAGISPDDFARKPLTVREIRDENGAQSPDSPATAIKNWSPEQKQEARDQLYNEAVEDLARENEARRSATTSTQEKATAKPVIGESLTERKKMEAAMAEVMHFSRSTIHRAETMTAKFEAAMPNVWWEKRLPGETVHRTHEEQVLGDLDRAAGAIQKARIAVAKVIDDLVDA